MKLIKNSNSKSIKTNMIALGAMACLASTSFSQVVIFSDDFESGTGNWNLVSTAGTGTVNWAVDATPSTAGSTAVPFAGTACLNYNDGVDYDDSSTNSGTATTVNSYDISTYLVPTLTFQSMSDTETGTFYDQKWVEISNDNFSTIIYSEQLDPNQQV